MLPFDTLSFTSKDRANKLVDRTLLNTYVNCPNLVVMTEKEVMKGKIFKDNNREGGFFQAVRRETVCTREYGGSEGGSRRNYPQAQLVGDRWKRFVADYTELYLRQLVQGSESTNAVLANLQLFANYNDREKAQWENLLDAKLGFSSAPSDEFHNYLVSTDQLRLYSKLGIQAASKWYYTITTEFKTQFLQWLQGQQ
mgnify:CR=1 FL=1